MANARKALAISRLEDIATTVSVELTIETSEQRLLMIIIKAAHCRVLHGRWQYGSSAIPQKPDPHIVELARRDSNTAGRPDISPGFQFSPGASEDLRRYVGYSGTDMIKNSSASGPMPDE